jgi:hypothetical protein
MDNEVLNKLIAQASAIERVVALLLSDSLKKLSEPDRMTFENALSPEGMKTLRPPRASNISDADDFAGRTIEYQRVVARILRAAQEIAGLEED